MDIVQRPTNMLVTESGKKTGFDTVLMDISTNDLNKENFCQATCDCLESAAGSGCFLDQHADNSIQPLIVKIASISQTDTIGEFVQ